MEIENPIGINVKYGQGYEGEIIGIVKDFNFKPLKESTTPLLICFNPESCNKIFIKTTGKDKETTLKYILDKNEEMKSWNQQAIYYWAEDDYQKLYEVELGIVNTLFLFTLISFTLSFMGIFSMISFMIDKRSKELAIRKINGAKITDIIKLFVSDITKVAIVSVVIAIPICYMLITNWLQTYVYRISLHWWLFLIISLLVISISSLLVALQVFYTAQQNPINSLRSE